MNRRFVSATGFDFLLPWYDWLVEPCTNERRMKRLVADEIASGDMSSVLDVGCGTGTLLGMLAKRSGKGKSSGKSSGVESELIGLDVDPRMLTRAASKLTSPGLSTTRDGQAASSKSNGCVRWVEGDACKLPFPSERFSTVVTTLTLHHLQDSEKKAAISECLRVLKPGGRLLVSDFAQPANRFAELQFLIVRFFDGFDRTRTHLGNRLAELIQRSGCKDTCEVFAMSSPIGTIRCYRAVKLGKPVRAGINCDSVDSRISAST